jgi:hypothetical protein
MDAAGPALATPCSRIPCACGKGEPTPRTLTPAEEEALQKGQPESSQGGAPNPNADEEARKLHPEDWNLAATAPAGVTTGATTSIERGSEAEKALKVVIPDP